MTSMTRDGRCGPEMLKPIGIVTICLGLMILTLAQLWHRRQRNLNSVAYSCVSCCARTWTPRSVIEESIARIVASCLQTMPRRRRPNPSRRRVAMTFIRYNTSRQCTDDRCRLQVAKHSLSAATLYAQITTAKFSYYYWWTLNFGPLFSQTDSR